MSLHPGRAALTRPVDHGSLEATLFRIDATRRQGEEVAVGIRRMAFLAGAFE